MRTLLPLAVVAGALLAACSRDAVGPPPPAPVDWQTLSARPRPRAAAAPTPQERSIAEAYAAALVAPGSGPLAARLDPNARLLFPGVADASGRDAVVRAHELLFGAFADRRIALTRVLRTDSSQLLEWTLEGVQVRDWFSVAPTRAPAVFRGLTILSTEDDGAVSSLHVYFDLAGVEAQLGGGPKELRALPRPAWPSEPAQTVERSGSTEELRDTDVVRRWIDALESIDRSAYLGSMSDDVEVTTLESARPARGKDAAAAYFDRVHGELAELGTTIDAIWAAGPFVALEYSMSGEQVAPIGWVPLLRDRVVELRVADVIELVDGKITRVWRYDNVAQADSPGP